MFFLQVDLFSRNKKSDEFFRNKNAGEIESF